MCTPSQGSLRDRITNELAQLRQRQLDESPEVKIIDSERTHKRINELLDQIDFKYVDAQCVS